MIISHRLKFAFFRVPKTGSTTMEFMLRLSDVFDQNDMLSASLQGGFPAVNVPDIESLRRQGKLMPGLVKGNHMHLTPE